MSSESIFLRDDPSQAANLYSLIYTLEHLERSYISGHSDKEEYEIECESLLGLCKVLEDATPDIFNCFTKEFDLNFSLALHRIRVGVPVTIEKCKKYPNENQNVMIFDLSGYFITLMDALRLRTTNVGELYPHLHILIDSIEQIDPCSKEDKEKLWNLKFLDRLKKWYEVLDKMKAHEELDENSFRQLMMDTESAYTSYREHLKIH